MLSEVAAAQAAAQAAPAAAAQQPAQLPPPPPPPVTQQQQEHDDIAIDDATVNASDEPIERPVRLPFFGNERAAKEHLGLDEVPFLPDIKESLGIDHEFMVIVSEESAYGRDERCRHARVVDGTNTESNAYWQSVDSVMADSNLLEALNFGEELLVPKGQSFIALSRDSDELAPVVMGIHMDEISNCSVDEGTIAGKWHNRKSVSECSLVQEVREFVGLRGKRGDPLRKLFPEKKRTPVETRRKGQINNHQGTFISCTKANGNSWSRDEKGEKLADGECFAVRGAMGPKNGKIAKKVDEIVDPLAAVADRLFRAWPKKLLKIPDFVSEAFDGSERLSYITTLLTVGNEDDDGLLEKLFKEEKLDVYCVKNAGKWIHVDDQNAEDTPNVAIVSGAFVGFDYYFPTLHLRVEAPSGMTFIGQFADLLHAVGGGTGVRVTTVYCQHEIIARKKRKLKNNRCHKLIGAKRSRSDIALGDNCGRIRCVTRYKFC